MDFDPLLSAPGTIPAHGLLALAALVLGAVQFAAPKGTLAHRGLGYVWVGCMGLVALTSFFIHEFRWLGPFGPIHLLSCFVLWSLGYGVHAARHGRVRAHKLHMIALYWQGLLLT
ncbi:MAG: DUF2306 domain-containing protein, partial [Pseudomonadota bacterium]